MSQVITFEDYRPTPRYDSLPWTAVRVEEGTASVGPWSLIDTVQFGTATYDADPANPAYRDITTEVASDTAALWYRLIFIDATGDVGLPTFPVQNVTGGRPIYATVDELAGLLRVKVTDRHDALRRVLETAAAEIDAELGLTAPYGSAPSLVVEVSLERAVEHWRQMQSPFGIIGIMGDQATAYSARDSWDRHAHKLSPLKVAWGVA